MRETLLQTEGKPLAGKRVVVTRPREQSSEFCEAIEHLGGEAYAFPTIRIAPPASFAPMDEAIRQLDRFQWGIFTSVNGVDAFFRRLRTIAPSVVERMGRLRVAAIGPKTASELEERGLTVEIIPREYKAEALLAALAENVRRGDRILLPRADIARKVLPDGLRQLGCDVTEVDAYRTEVETECASEVVRMLADGKLDIVTFTSSSTVRNFVAALDATGLPWRRDLSRTNIACIGPITARTARELGLEPDVVATTYTMVGLLEAITSV